MVYINLLEDYIILIYRSQYNVITSYIVNYNFFIGYKIYRKNKNKRFKFQWIELYNPTDHDISLKNWTITDNSGRPTVIRANKKIKAGGFALLSKDASLWKYWNEPKSALKVELGKIIGNGMDASGDLLILKNNGVEADRMSWGGTIPTVPPGHSTERLVPGFDTDVFTDWLDRFPPTPGN